MKMNPKRSLPRPDEPSVQKKARIDLTDSISQGFSKGKLIIGLDFGTTYSGVAYAFEQDANPAVISITDWPGVEGRTLAKVPTVVKYGDGDLAWGYKVSSLDESRITEMKLLLNPDQPRPAFLSFANTPFQGRSLGKAAHLIAADFFSAIYEHSMAKICGSWPKDYIDTLEKSFVLSVPAIWDEKAKDATLKAAARAGIGPIRLVTEPEAAAIYTLHSMKDKALRVGDRFVVCDAGGGTADLIAYEITSIRPFELKEVAPATGGLVGSIMLNKRFEELLHVVLGDAQFRQIYGKKAFQSAMKDFDEKIKPSFMPGCDDEFFVMFPLARIQDDPEKNIEANCLRLTERDLLQIFEPVISYILELVAEQVTLAHKNLEQEKCLKAIFLVGGFGSSQYLHKSLREAYPDIQVIQPNEAWSAIARGAVLHQLPKTVEVISNVAPKHYGVWYTSPVDDIKDAGRKTWWDELDEVYRVDRMEWLLKKGDDLVRTRETVLKLHATFEIKKTTSFIRHDVLYECTSAEPPEYIEQGGFVQNVKLKVDIRDVPRTEFLKMRNSRGVKYYRVPYEIVITIGSAGLQFSVRTNGKTLGTVEAKYD